MYLFFMLLLLHSSQSLLENSSLLYKRASSSEILNNSTELLKNNSVAIPDRDIFGNRGIVCASPSTEEEVRINWFNPSNEVINRNSDPLFATSLSPSNDRQQKELRAMGNFYYNGIYTCILNISNSFSFLYIGLYTGRQQLNEVILSVNNSRGALILSCSSSGLPAEEVNWYLDDQWINVATQVTVITDRSLSAYRTDFILYSDDVTINGTECLRCEVIANRTNAANSSCYMTDVIVSIATPFVTFNGSHLQWDGSNSLLPAISYDVEMIGGHCNDTFTQSWNTRNLSLINQDYQLSLSSIGNLDAGATYYTLIRASNGFASSRWSDGVMVTTPAKPPSGYPLNLVSESNETFIHLSWNELNCTERNGVIDSYAVIYEDVQSNSTTTRMVEGLQIVLDELLPSTVYTISLAAFNRHAGMGPFVNLSVKTTDVLTEPPETTTFLLEQSKTPETTIFLSEQSFCDSLGLNSLPICAVAAAVAGICVILLLLCCCCTFCILYRLTKIRKIHSSPASEALLEMDNIDHSSNLLQVVPTIDIFPDDMEAFEGEHVIFNISVSGRPPPTLTWYHNDEEIQKDLSIDISNNGTLSITSVENEHSGIYRLVGSNSAGTCSAELELTLVEDEAFPLRSAASMASMVSSSAVPVASFEDYIDRHHHRNNRKFHIEFVSLESCSDHPVTVGMNTENRNYNRFKNITPYDDNRVVLQSLDDCEDFQNEYINASYVDGYDTTKFIATQGPLPHTLIDFWRLVWQEKSQVIVMLCDIVEGRRVRCHQYWPDVGVRKYGAITVQNLEEKKLADYVIRTLEVTMPKHSDSSLKVKQYQYISWPHHSVPDNAGAFISFCKVATTLNNNTNMGPILVHDSAGVGRTGVFIALNTALQQAREDQEVNIMEIITNMRQQRMKMVQTLSEYIFIHDATLESLVCGETQIPVTNFRSMWRKLNKTDKETGKTGLEKQFQLLVKITSNPNEIDRTAAFQWPHCNRCMKYLPRDQGRVVLSSIECDYIHASFVDGYKKKKAFIIAQGPLKNTCGAFWQMIHQYHCKTIVMLSELIEYNQEMCHQYWPEVGQSTYGDTEVSVGTECSVGNLVTRTFKYRVKQQQQEEEEGADVQTVTQVQLLNWTPDGLCADYKPVVDLMNQVMLTQRQTGDQPIIIHCSDTVSRSAIFCAAMTAVEWFKTEAAVDIFHVVKLLRHQKPGAVLTVEQYSAIYSIVLAYIDTIDNYANFQKT